MRSPLRKFTPKLSENHGLDLGFALGFLELLGLLLRFEGACWCFSVYPFRFLMTSWWRHLLQSGGGRGSGPTPHRVMSFDGYIAYAFDVLDEVPQRIFLSEYMYVRVAVYAQGRHFQHGTRT